MSITHPRILWILSVPAVIALSANAAPAQAQVSPQPAQAQQPAQVTQTVRGELLSVDASAKMLVIKPTEGAEQRFQYTDQTKVTGARGGVAGLATMGGRQIVVYFSSQGGSRIATDIELQPAQSEK